MHAFHWIQKISAMISSNITSPHFFSFALSKVRVLIRGHLGGSVRLSVRLLVFGSGRDLRVVRSSPQWGVCWRERESQADTPLSAELGWGLISQPSNKGLSRRNLSQMLNQLSHQGAP